MAKLPNIEYAGDFAKYVEASDSTYDCISFYKPAEYFSVSENYPKFIKACEKTVDLFLWRYYRNASWAFTYTLGLRLSNP